MSLLSKRIEKIKKISEYGLSKIIVIVFRRYIYQVVWMGQYGVRAGESITPEREFEYEIEFWGLDRYSNIIESGIDPYMKQADVDEFKRCKSICIVTKDNNKIVASAWMVPGGQKYYYSELDRKIKIEKKDFFSRRNFVHTDYRGKHILGHMINEFAKKYFVSGGKLWAFIFNWNISSVKAFSRIGWQHERNVGFVKCLGFKWCVYKGPESKVGYLTSLETTPAGDVITNNNDKLYRLFHHHQNQEPAGDVITNNNDKSTK